MQSNGVFAEALEAAFTEAAEVEGEELINTFSDVLAERRKREAEERSTEKDQAVQEPRKRRRANTAESVASQESTADNSTIYMDLWRDTVGLQLGIDNRTRWNSWYYFISRAKRMKPQIVEFMFQHEVALGDNRLTGEDWQILDRAHEFLETFAEATLYAEGKSSIAQPLLIIEILLKKFEDEKKRYSSGPEKDLRMVRAINMGWFVLNKYYSRADEVPAYGAAILLDPSSRRAYLDTFWEKAWVDSAIKSAGIIWEEEFNTQFTEDTYLTGDAAAVVELDLVKLNSFAKYKAKQRLKVVVSANAKAILPSSLSNGYHYPLNSCRVCRARRGVLKSSENMFMESSQANASEY
ncbi:Dimer-Tnp-hAT domain containing protein [Pyrenophora tritici-repentis]|uniref:Dimer-Tnp-hAT domain containing protein n=1 Tax=Pyrenophora tritici-repentis TaxID=45151 RepID=A0A922N3U6_9PLEO|nr:Dimer-Tnp-hAT domain containing protein [Pyrenophora tritici-repentis]KAI1685729.1 Dimer-Tnp-hAT domain containing protein [Pyrenophora tritici-repentis]